jgi:FkbM family methyltransferase
MTTYASHGYAFGAETRQLHYCKNSSDETVIAAILVRQQYDLGHIVCVAELMDYAKRAESSGRKPLIVDAGANIGAASIFFAAKMPSARIVAIEPDRENFQLLYRNVEGLGVETVNAAVSATSGRARVVDPDRGPWAYRTQSIADDDTATGAVPRITINDIFQAHTAAMFPQDRHRGCRRRLVFRQHRMGRTQPAHHRRVARLGATQGEDVAAVPAMHLTARPRLNLSR